MGIYTGSQAGRQVTGHGMGTLVTQAGRQTGLAVVGNQVAQWGSWTVEGAGTAAGCS